MDIAVQIDLVQAARELALPADSVQRTVELLDEGNTVPFITRYRREQTGALDEEQIRRIQDKVGKMRLLADRKQTILKSIHAQGKLTPSLANRIRGANSPKRLEDLYLPYKPKKQTLATVARQRGLEPLARRVLEPGLSATELQEAAAERVDAERGLTSVEDVVTGVGHILAEWFSEQPELRGRLRKLIRQHGKLVCRRATAPVRRDSQPPVAAPAAPDPPPPPTPAEEPGDPAGRIAEAAGAGDAEAATAAAATNAPVDAGSAVQPAQPDSAPAGASAAAGSTPGAPPAATTPAPAAARSGKRGPLAAKLGKREKKREKQEAAFKDYFEFEEAISKLPHHRVLAINRGERARVLRVRIEVDTEALIGQAEQQLVPAGHPGTDLLRGCVRDALVRLVLPSLEREVRRELTERAEQHAVEVFARNLRKLLLQPPVHKRRVLAIDPGYRSGCKVIALDQFGNVLDHTVIHVVGSKERIQQGRQQLVELIRNHQLTAVAIGNGTACRETEQLVGSMIAEELRDTEVAFVIVNEAGASVYSTSPLGREELPDYDPTLRSAISIGRRLLDPLSELVKINPANIGVGMYQHDVKAKHLRSSLDAVVESCVNFVGVDANTASPALLRYVSGLNQLTARRLCEYRAERGPFRSRAQFREVPGFGEAAFVQAAGFLRITDGTNPFDATWIHPESYPLAERVLQRFGPSMAEFAELARGEPAAECRGQSAEQPATAATAEPPEGRDSSEQTAGVSPEPSLAARSAAPATGVAAADERQPSLTERIAHADVAALGEELQISRLLLEDILGALARPGRDPREDLPPPVFRRGVVHLEDLEPGMELSGTVLNVVDFGAFVDIGLPDSGLVHISRLADRFIRDPHEVVGVGDVLRVWVVEVDKRRRRVSLTAIDPHAPPPAPPPSRRRPAGKAAAAAAKGGKPRRPKPERGKREPSKPVRAAKPPRRRKPVTPITKEMEEGKEPLRSFSDLLQFYQKKQADEDQQQP